MLCSAVFAADTPPGAVGAKTHTLFMGADILVEQDHEAYRVEDVVGGSFVIKVRGKVVKVPASWGTIKMKVDRSLKLTATSVYVDKLKVERAYTPGNDPVKQFMAQQGEAMAQQDAVADLVVKLDQAQMMQRIGGGVIIPGLTGDPATLERELHQAEGRGLAAGGNFGGMVGHMQDDLAKENFDAIDVVFDVSSAKLLRDPYLVILAQFHAREAKPGESQNWLYAAQLDPLDSKPQKVRIRKGGFPLGYVLERYQVHVYDHGREVATNVAENQVQLTRDEAFAYLVLDYIGSHKGATLPAAPALGKLSQEDASRLNQAQLTQTFYVKVSKDGMPAAAFADAEMTAPVDPVVAFLVGNVRFYPALEKGKAIEGMAELRFSHLGL